MRPATAGGMEQKPIARQLRHLLERSRFFEEMRCAGDDLDLHFASHLRASLFIKVDDHVIFTADDE